MPGRRIAAIALALLACAVAAGMAAYQWRLVSSFPDPIFGTGGERVLDSSAAQMIRAVTGIPDAALGAIAYLAEAILGSAGGRRRAREHPWVVILFAAVAVPLALSSFALVAVQALVVHAWCSACLFTAGCSLGILALSWSEIREAVRNLRR